MKNNWLNLRPLRRMGLLLLAVLLPLVAAVAQPAAEASPEMADALRQSGKIYVVGAVIVAILAGLLLYLVSIDRKVRRLERECATDQYHLLAADFFAPLQLFNKG